MPWNDKPRISLSDMQARLASNREMLQKNSSPTKTPSKSYLRKQRKLKANAKSEDEAEANIEVEANDEVSKDTEITKIMKNQQKMRKEFMEMLTRVEKLEEKIENIDKRVFALEAVDQNVDNIDQKIMALKDFDKKVENIDQKNCCPRKF